MIATLLALTLAAPLPAAAPTPPPTPPLPVDQPQPIGEPARWVTNADYPIRELSRGVQGRTQLELDVSDQGQPVACRIIDSSGSVGLDRTACRRMMERARFHPARDAAGLAIPSRWRRAVYWAIAEF